MSDLQHDLKALLNRHSRENESGTADFILAEYLLGALAAFERGILARDKWWGWQPKIGGVIPAYGPLEPLGIDTLPSDSEPS